MLFFGRRLFSTTSSEFLILGSSPLRRKFELLSSRFKEVSEQLQKEQDSESVISLSKEQNELRSVNELFAEIIALEEYVKDCSEMEKNGEDEEEKEFAMNEKERSVAEIKEKVNRERELYICRDRED